MTRRRRGSSRRPSNAVEPRGPRPARGAPADGRVRAGTATRKRAISPAWLAIGAALAVGLAIALLFLPRLLGGPGSTASGSPSGQAAGGCPTSQPAALPAGERRTVRLATELGAIPITVEADLSPIAAGNFVALAECGFYDGVGFHRVVPTFVIQAGDPTGSGSGGPGYNIQDEPVTTTYQRGTVAMARSAGANSVGSQFVIVLSDEAARSLAAPGYNNYQIIGSTDEAGMAVADQIAAAADAENPSNPVVITDAFVEPQ